MDDFSETENLFMSGTHMEVLAASQIERQETRRAES